MVGIGPSTIGGGVVPRKGEVTKKCLQSTKSGREGKGGGDPYTAKEEIELNPYLFGKKETLNL